MRYFLDKTITLRRLRKIDINRSVFSATGTAAGYKASKQNPNPDMVQFNSGDIGNVFFFYMDISCPVEVSDQIVHAGITYSVTEMKVQDFGSTQYKRILVTRKI